MVHCYELLVIFRYTLALKDFHSFPRSSLMEEKRRLESRLSSVEDELEEEQQNSEQAQERIRRSQQQVRRVAHSVLV